MKTIFGEKKEVNFLILIRNTLQNPLANILLSEWLNAFSLFYFIEKNTIVVLFNMESTIRNKAEMSVWTTFTF